MRHFLVFLLLFVIAACGDDAPASQTATSADTLDSQNDIALNLPDSENLADTAGRYDTEVPDDVPQDIVPEDIDGVQVIRIQVGPTGYLPTRVLLQAGVPARLIFTRTTPGECAKQVQIPKYGIRRTNLPLDEDVAIEFTPTDPGEFAFNCGRNDMTGTIIVES